MTFSNPRQLFGTDGVRGIANQDLDVDLAVGLARAVGESLPGGPVVIGRDTRRSGEMLSAAFQAGFHSVGVDTIDVGVIPVGGVSALIVAMQASLGTMVSASHNPAIDNGVKFFTAAGEKFDEQAEHAIEQRLATGAPWKTPVGVQVGASQGSEGSLARYLELLRNQAGGSLHGIRLALDCAHGAAYQAAPDLFSSLGADVVTHFAQPDGMNINQGCGATTPSALAVRAEGRIGLAFDGDADRLFVIDEDGQVANGDVIMAIIARFLKAQGRLTNNLVVATVMSNLGFRQAMEQAGIELVETQVGDRYVLEEMIRRQAVLGGEQSGHVIQLDRARTGDGLLTALCLLEAVVQTGLEVRELRRQAITEFPQVLCNVEVEDKAGLESAGRLWQAVAEAEFELGDQGRVLVRASGTEPLVRVMVEAATISLADRTANHLAQLVTNELG